MIDAQKDGSVLERFIVDDNKEKERVRKREREMNEVI